MPESKLNLQLLVFELIEASNENLLRWVKTFHGATLFEKLEHAFLTFLWSIESIEVVSSAQSRWNLSIV